jgi:NADH-quinone oxidoreductase subunit L
MTFLGENRTGEAERAKLHEAPWIMTGPLIVLGVLSAVGGAINLPPMFGGHELLEHWLDPVLAPALKLRPLVMPEGSTEYLLVGAAVLVGVVGLVAGIRATLARPMVPARQAPPDVGLARVIYRKFYVDEIYNALLVRPVVWLSDKVLWRIVDQTLVDGLAVTGGVRVTYLIGRLGSRLQNGQLGFYAVLFVVGVIWVLRTIMG